MPRILLLIGAIIFLIVGIGYLYSPNTILKFNQYLTNIFFDNKRLLLERKKTGILLLLLSLILFLATFLYGQ